MGSNPTATANHDDEGPDTLSVGSFSFVERAGLGEARGVLRESGAESSLEEIARRAGVGIGTLYRRFPTRLSLLEAVYREDVDALGENTARLVEKEQPWEALEAWVWVLLDYAATKRALFQELVDAVGRDSELLTHSREAVNGAANMVLRNAQQAGAVWDIGAVDELAAPPTPVFFLAGGTGISAETLGNMMLQQFPSVSFTRRKIPFITTAEQAEQVLSELDAAITESVMPLVFSTVSDEDVRAALQKTRCAFIDLFGSHLDTVERVLHVNATHGVGALHGLGDTRRYDARMKAIEFSMEHDDGASVRNLDQADLILVAPSRCGKTPTSMYLALQHGLKVANYPLVEEDFDEGGVPRPIRGLVAKCFGLLSTPARLSQVRGERRPGSTYASLAQCSYELRRAEALYRAHRIPSINSASMSVEEMAAVIMQTSRLGNLA